MPAAARLPRTPSVVDACFAALGARRSAATGVFTEEQAGAFLLQDFNDAGFMMPVSVFELEMRAGDGRTSQLKETEITPALERSFAHTQYSGLMKVPLGWNYGRGQETKKMLYEALGNLLLAIMNLPGGTEYSAIYVKKVHEKDDSSQPVPWRPNPARGLLQMLDFQRAGGILKRTDAMVKVAAYNPDTGKVDVYKSGSLDHMVYGILRNVRSMLEAAPNAAPGEVAQGALEFLRTDPMRIFISKGSRAEELFSELGTKNAAKDHEDAMNELVNMMSGGGSGGSGSGSGSGDMDTTRAAFAADLERAMYCLGKDYRACLAKHRAAKAEKARARS